MTTALTASEYAKLMASRYDYLAKDPGNFDARCFAVAADMLRREIPQLKAAEEQQRADAVKRVFHKLCNRYGGPGNLNAIQLADVRREAEEYVDACFGRESELKQDNGRT